MSTTKYNQVDKEEREVDDPVLVHDEAPVAIAEEVLPFDGISTAKDDAVMGEGAGTVVRVVAPSYLPQGFKLLVKTTDGETHEVLVPRMVLVGEEFEAEIIAPTPIEFRFSDGICGCCEGDCDWLCLAWFCQGLAFAAIMEKLGLTSCAERVANRPKDTFVVVSNLWWLYVVCHFGRFLIIIIAGIDIPVLGLSALALAIYFIVIATKTRIAFRHRYRIPGDCCVDCLASYFCGCCSAMQMYRHLKRSGERPGQYAVEGQPALAEIV